LSDENHQGGEHRFRRSPTGPSVTPPCTLTSQPPAPPTRAVRYRPSYWSVAIFVLLIAGVGIRAFRDLSRPEAWDYWKDQYVSPSLTASVITKLDLDGAAAAGAPCSSAARSDLLPRTGSAANWTRPI